MDDPLVSLKIHILKAQIEACRTECIAYAKEYEASSTIEQKEKIAIRWDWVMRHLRLLKSDVEQLEKLGVYSPTLN
jgi:hypothetical protein